MTVTPDLIAAAAERTIARRTPLEKSARLSEKIGAEVYLKREDQQLARSYKVRGAYNLMSLLTPEELARGVVCASAGNHAQGVAISCARLGAKGHIFVPTSTPRQKRDRILALGGDAVTLTLVGSTYDESAAAAQAYARDTDATFVHAFDDERTVAGQGTVGVELTDQALTDAGGPLDALIVPIGGGGFMGGVATWVKSVWPECRIIGAEPVGAASMKAALRSGGPVTLEHLDTFVDGASVATIGATPYAIAKELVDEVVEVPVGAICVEMLDLYQTEGIIAEPAGALAAAALGQIKGLTGRVGVIISGGNNDVSRYPDVVERAVVYQGLRHYFLVSFPQEPGALRGFLDNVLSDGEDIVVFDYIKRSNRETGPALVGIDLDHPEGLAGLLERMAASHLLIEKIDNDSELFTFLR
ncbi:threonine ammonia-lyase IlvA [Nocardioides sp.]|uniref:threonine ammonia-lyase IlvA n=1 Tax=Nocardioides sp. TaxID=35761 RepID=UPI002620AC36|nr:threonine ammonia-lyase IlvA [Nocardioides sp.]